MLFPKSAISTYVYCELSEQRESQNTLTELRRLLYKLAIQQEQTKKNIVRNKK